MAGEMITSLKALLSPQMAKYVGSSCSQQLDMVREKEVRRLSSTLA